MWFVILVSMVCVQWSQAALPLPSYIKPCARNDPQLYECSAKHANDAISHLLKGDPKYKMPALDPFKIDELKLVQGEGPRNSIALLLKNMSSYVNKVILLEKSEYDFKKKHIFHQVIIPRVDNVGKYEIQGRLLLLPIFGQGDFNITLDNCRITYDADFIYETIDGKEYFSERNQATTITPTNVNIEFTNLFNGDKLLVMASFLNELCVKGTVRHAIEGYAETSHCSNGPMICKANWKQMNEFLNKNWREWYKELSPTIFSAYSQIISTVFKGLYETVPVSEMFPKTVHS